jgi:hypothetical protein
MSYPEINTNQSEPINATSKNVLLFPLPEIAVSLELAFPAYPAITSPCVYLFTVETERLSPEVNELLRANEPSPVGVALEPLPTAAVL